jgi:6-phosphogluconolactonase
MVITVNCKIKRKLMELPVVRILSSVEELSEVVAEIIWSALNHLKDERKLTVALPGGSTPAMVFRYLSVRHKATIDWTKIDFFWGDERCVPPEHEESNFRMARINLMDPLGITEGNIHRVRGEDDPEQALEHYTRVLHSQVRQHDNLPSFDLILLGMGDDGHTASLFPDDESALASDDACIVASHPDTGQKRITLTLPVLNNARQVVFLVTGISKAEMVKKVLSPGKKDALPAAIVKPLNGEIVWLLDKEAGSSIEYLL